MTSAEILDAIRRWYEIYGEPPAMTDWDPYRARATGQTWRVTRYESGDWPSTKSVLNHFGRLSLAVAAAGLVPRHQGQQRARQDPGLDERMLLHLARIRTARRRSNPLDQLASALRGVAQARASTEADDLRAALVILAAAALAWAADVDAPAAEKT